MAMLSFEDRVRGGMLIRRRPLTSVMLGSLHYIVFAWLDFCHDLVEHRAWPLISGILASQLLTK